MTLWVEKYQCKQDGGFCFLLLNGAEKKNDSRIDARRFSFYRIFVYELCICCTKYGKHEFKWFSVDYCLLCNIFHSNSKLYSDSRRFNHITKLLLIHRRDSFKYSGDGVGIGGMGEGGGYMRLKLTFPPF